MAVIMIGGWFAIASGLQRSEPEAEAIVDIVDAISAESIAVTNSYFGGPEALAEVIASALERDLDQAAHVDLLRDLTISQANLDGSFIGYPDGSFLDVRRYPNDVLQIKTIEFIDGVRTVTTDVLDIDGNLIDQFPSLSDDYDPTIRPWYIGASDGETHWTEPYIFFASREPGVTHSVPVLDQAGQTLAIVGVDIRLTNLEAFLQARQPSENGSAAVVDQSGTLIAGSARLADADGNGFANLLSSSQSTTATEQNINGETTIVSVAPLDTAGERLLIVAAPQTDFLSDVRTTREGLAVVAGVLGGVGVVLLAIGAMLLQRYLAAIHRLASTDTLTGLKNRTTVNREIDRALSNGSTVSVMTHDLDQFKLVNDRYGHQCGDELLIRTATRLTRTAPTNALIGRLGGDEFCMAFVDAADPHELCRSVVFGTAGPAEIDGHVFDTALSAGYVVAGLEDSDAELLLQRADVAMYAAKLRPGTAVVEFDSSMRLPWRVDNDRELSILAALETGAIDVIVHPERDLRTGDVLGAEIHLCWDHPSEGKIDAADFFGDIKRFGLLERVTPMILTEAARIAAVAADRPGFRIQLNVSKEHVISPELFEQLTQCVQNQQVRWSIELSEGEISHVSSAHPAALTTLRELGVEIVIDDFGTGLFSLSSLRSAPVDAIKIAPEFVHAIDAHDYDRPLARATIGLGAVLGIEVIATGVTSEAQKAALLANGCIRGLGAFFGRSLHPDEFIEMLSQHEAKAA